MNASIEIKRAEKEIGSSLEAAVTIKVENTYYELLKNYDLSEICITSKADTILDKNSNEDISVETFKAKGTKCNVCWKIFQEKCDRHGHLK